MKDRSLSSFLPHLRDKIFRVSLSPQNTIRWECPYCRTVTIRKIEKKSVYNSFVCSHCKREF